MTQLARQLLVENYFQTPSLALWATENFWKGSSFSKEGKPYKANVKVFYNANLCSSFSKEGKPYKANVKESFSKEGKPYKSNVK
ncbi:hypothetical protein U9M48_029741, partial [Paspalum notatum var. saurae]